MAHSRRNLRGSKRKGNRSKKNRTIRSSRLDLGYESLEARQMLAFTFGFDGTTLTLDQTVDDGAIIIDNNGAGDAIQTTDGSGTVTYSAATNLIVNLLDGTSNQLDVDLDNAHVGDVTLNLGDGARTVNFTGASNDIGGSLMVFAGSDSQTVEIAAGANFSVGANASFDLGTGFDTVDEDGNDVSITGDLSLIGVNEFENNGTMSIGGNVTMDVSAEAETTRFDDDSELAIGGDFTFTGSDGRDEILLNDTGATTVGGNVFVDLADNTAGGTQFAWWNSSDTTIAGNVTVLSTSSTNADDVQGIAGASVGGDILIDLGDGQNEADLLGTIGGTTVEYVGGSGDDDVAYDMSGSFVDVTATLGDGDDSFLLGPNVTIAPTTLIVDFGDNNDTYTNNFGAYLFDVQLLGIDGFDYAYTLATDSLEVTQIAAPAPLVTVDNNGTGGAVRVINTVATEFGTATNLTVNMLDSGASDLNVALDNALAGDLTINLGDGTRALNLNGTDNSIGGNLNITGGADDQTLEIAVNNSLTVGGDLLFSLGDGIDVADEDNNDIAVTGNWDFIGVNAFENGGTMTVGGNVTIDSTIETNDTVFDDDATMTINGNYTYIGGDGRDESTMNGVAGGTSILGNALVDVGDNTVGGVQFVFFNLPNASIGGTLDVISTSATNFDSFSLHPSASVGGDINVDLGDGSNDAGFSGTFGGSSVTYRGGDGTDTVFYGMTGNLADVNAILGAGDDEFSLGAGAAISPTTLRVDYGGGVDNFINGYGAFDFNAAFLNMGGFDRFYSDALDQWHMFQLTNSGDVTVDNNGPGNAIQLTHGYATSMSPASSIRLNMLNGTGDVTVDLGSALTGSAYLTLGHGDRAVNFNGASNTIGGFLRVEAADGEQSVELAENADLQVGENAIINLRDGADQVTHANNLDAGTLTFRGVNVYENQSAVSVANNFVFNTTFFTEDSRIDNDGAMNVTGQLIYIGGAGQDDILLNDGVTIGGAFLDVGSGIGFPGQNIDLTGGFNSAGRITVVAGEAFGGNSLTMDSLTVLGGDVVVDFSASVTNNQVLFEGMFAGSYGVYRGGAGGDIVNMDAVATDMDFILQLGDEADTFNLLGGTDVSFLFANFGDGDDTFNDDFAGVYPFPVVISGL